VTSCPRILACTAEQAACSDTSISRASDFLSAPNETMREMPSFFARRCMQPCEL